MFTLFKRFFQWFYTHESSLGGLTGGYSIEDPLEEDPLEETKEELDEDYDQLYEQIHLNQSIVFP